MSVGALSRILFEGDGPMIRSRSPLAVAVTLLMLPVPLLAGGPPLLCLPVDGVTSQNVQACTELLNSKLRNKLSRDRDRVDGIKLFQWKTQWYLAFYMDSDVRLSDVKAALGTGAYSI